MNRCFRSNEEGYRFVAEQVSHHPPISAFHAQFRFGEFFGTVSPRVKFWGISIEILPCAKFFLKLTRFLFLFIFISLLLLIQKFYIKLFLKF